MRSIDKADYLGYLKREIAEESRAIEEMLDYYNSTKKELDIWCPGITLMEEYVEVGKLLRLSNEICVRQHKLYFCLKELIAVVERTPG